MHEGRIGSRISALALAMSAPALLGTTGLTNNFEQRILAAQNRERDAVGVGPLQWNATLAASAQDWADHLAATGRFAHAPENHQEPQGENLWAGSKGHYGLEAMVAAWTRERAFFKPGRIPNNSTTGRFEDVGHYTQLMWRATRQVGCAWATGAKEDVLVCRYTEAGNRIGEVPF